MATFYADNVTKARTVPSTLVEADAASDVKRKFDKWSLAGASVTNNDLVQVGTIPAGARLLPDSYVDFGAFGTSGAAVIGTAANDDEFAVTADVSSAVRVTLAANLDYVATVDTPVYVKITNKGNAATLTLYAHLKFLF